MTTTATPEIPQHMRALERANQMRISRSQILRELRRGEVMFYDLDLEAPEFKNFTVFKLLQSLPWARRTPTANVNRRVAKAGPTKVLRAAGIAPTFTVGKLTQRQRDSLLWAVSEICPSQRSQSSVGGGLR